MFLPERQHLRVYAHLAPVDMRKQRHGLAALAQNVIAQDPCGGALFVFIGKGRNKLKILYWHQNGFALWYKVIEGREKFCWPRSRNMTSVTLSADQLQWLLEGYDIWKMKPHRTLHFTQIG
jgi:transposase